MSLNIYFITVITPEFITRQDFIQVIRENKYTKIPKSVSDSPSRGQSGEAKQTKPLGQGGKGNENESFGQSRKGKRKET